MNDGSMVKSKRVDRRVLKTKKALFEAFDRLIAVKDYDKITISELARSADIDRKTFYLHYSSIDEMFDDRVDNIVSDILDSVEEDMRRRAYDEAAEGHLEDIEPDPYIFFLGISRAVRESASVRNHVFTVMPAEKLTEKLVHPLVAEIRKRGMLPTEAKGPVFDIYAASLMGGIIGAYGAWVKSGLEVPDEEISSVAARMMEACGREFTRYEREQGVFGTH